MTLVDTSSWIEALRRQGDPTIQERVRALLTSGEAAWCDLVRLELWAGSHGQRESRVLRDFERDLPRLETNAEVWELACNLARRLRTAGVTIPATDLLILACARHHGARLEHADRHFDVAERALAKR